MSSESSYGGYGCTGLIISAVAGGFALHYDLTHWVPVLHNMFPAAIGNPPIRYSAVLFLFGIPLGAPAWVLAVITWLLVGLGVIQ